MRRAHPTEHQEQVALCDWWRIACKGYGLPEYVLLAIPNAGGFSGNFKSNVVRVQKLMREGVRKGAPDMLLAVPTRCRDDEGNATGYLGDPGLFIENKRKGEKPTESQAEFHLALRRLGWHVVVAQGFEEAKRAITAYLKDYRRQA